MLLKAETPLPTCATAVAVPPTWLVAVACTEFTLPKLVCAVACTCPLEPIAVDRARAVLPLAVVANEFEFAAPGFPVAPRGLDTKIGFPPMELAY
jgi:hypothetical protein